MREFEYRFIRLQANGNSNSGAASSKEKKAPPPKKVVPAQSNLGQSGPIKWDPNKKTVSIVKDD